MSKNHLKYYVYKTELLSQDSWQMNYFKFDDGMGIGRER
jgi:hypothetical protein